MSQVSAESVSGLYFPSEYSHELSWQLCCCTEFDVKNGYKVNHPIFKTYVQGNRNEKRKLN